MAQHGYSDDIYKLYLKQFKRDGIKTDEEKIKFEIDLQGA